MCVGKHPLKGTCVWRFWERNDRIFMYYASGQVNWQCPSFPWCNSEHEFSSEWL